MNNAALRHVAVLVAAIGWLSHAAAAAPLSIDSVQKQMAWGEYDKIIATVEPAVKNKALPADARLASNFLKFLGVAYFASGKIAEAREAFSKAFDLNPSVVLEDFYVSKEIGDFFNVAISDEKQQIAARSRADSLANVREIDRISSMYRARFSLSVTSFVMCGISAAIAAYEYHEGDSLYQEWNAARQLPRGDRTTYNALKPLIRTADLITETGAVVAIITAASGTYFTVRARQIRKTKKKLLLKKVSAEISLHPSFRLSFDF